MSEADAASPSGLRTWKGTQKGTLDPGKVPFWILFRIPSILYRSLTFLRALRDNVVNVVFGRSIA